MRKLAKCAAGAILAAGLLVAVPAMAQMGGQMGGMGDQAGGGMGDPGGGGRGGHGHQEGGEGEGERHGGERPQDMKPIPREKFDRAVTALFARADLDRNGMVTLAELQSVIDQRRDAVIRARFKDLDTNHDGRIDADEFVAWQKAMGSAAASDCAGYARAGEIVPDVLRPELGSGEQDEALGIAIEPLSATVLTKANVHYGPGMTLADLLAYEDARFAAADTNHDDYLDSQEIRALGGRAGGRGGPGGPGGWRGGPGRGRGGDQGPPPDQPDN